MKILMYSHGFGGPTTTFIYNEMKYLTQKGHQVFYLCNEYQYNEIEDCCKVIQIPFNESKIWKKIKWILWKKDLLLIEKNRFFKKQLNLLLKKINPDVIHCHFSYESIRLVQNLPNKYPNPIIIHVHGYGGSQMLKKKSYVKELSKILNHDNRWLILVSDLIKKRFQNFNLTRSIRINCGINLDLFDSNNDDHELTDQFIFLQVSSLALKKGHVFSIKAFKKFLSKVEKPERFKFVFTGYNSKHKKIKKLITDLNLEKNVQILSFVKPKDVKKMLQKANVFLHHSVTPINGDEEGIPTAIMEAMAMKLPILSTYHAGIPELVTHGVNGLLSQEKDIETLSNQMLEIISWSKLNENRTKIQKHFNYQTHNELLLDFYNKIIENN